jgi:alpha-L-rhamnosidase
LTQASGKLNTPYGELVSQWTLTDDTFEWTVIVPPNTSATVRLPVQEVREITRNGQIVSGLVHEVEAGEYHFVVN